VRKHGTALATLRAMSRKRRHAGIGNTVKLAGWAVALSLLAACAGAPDDWTDEDALSDDGVTSLSVIDDWEPAPGMDSSVGTPVDDPDPVPGDDPCIEQDDCSPPPPDEGSTDEGSGGGAPAEPAPTQGSTPEYAVNAVLLTLTYAPLRKHPDSQAETVGVHVNGGAHGGHPKGRVPPGQAVTVLDAAPTNGFYKVEYLNHEGWIHGNKLTLFDTTVHPVKFARRSGVRNAFFMHQLRRTRWNKDGPSSSANCAPTSLAMAAKIFGHGTPAKTIEQSIHEARRQYDPAPLCEGCSTSRSDIRNAAQKLGLHVKTLNAVGSVEYRMDRIDQALGNKHVVVLEGYPGAMYRERMTEAYRNSDNEWIQNRAYTYGDEPDEYHSILVVSRLNNGKYLVADPLSEVGMVTMSREILKSFFKRWGGTGNVVW